MWLTFNSSHLCTSVPCQGESRTHTRYTALKRYCSVEHYQRYSGEKGAAETDDFLLSLTQHPPACFYCQIQVVSRNPAKDAAFSSTTKEKMWRVGYKDSLHLSFLAFQTVTSVFPLSSHSPRDAASSSTTKNIVNGRAISKKKPSYD